MISRILALHHFIGTIAGIIPLLACASVLTSMSIAEAQSKKLKMPQIFTQLVAAATAEHPRHTEGTMIKLNGGRILFAYTEYYAGDPADPAPSRIVAIYTSDGGRSWTNPIMVVENTAQQNVRSPSLLRVRSGAIALFYIHGNSSWDSKIYMKTSNDEGKSWSASVCSTPADGYFVMHNDRAIQLKSGRLLVPVSYLRIGRNGIIQRRTAFTRTMKGKRGRSQKPSMTCRSAVLRNLLLLSFWTAHS